MTWNKHLFCALHFLSRFLPCKIDPYLDEEHHSSPSHQEGDLREGLGHIAHFAEKDHPGRVAGISCRWAPWLFRLFFHARREPGHLSPRVQNRRYRIDPRDALHVYRGTAAAALGSEDTYFLLNSTVTFWFASLTYRSVMTFGCLTFPVAYLKRVVCDGPSSPITR